MSAPGDRATAPTIRPPLQQRSREAWNRVLDAGVALLEEGGYEAFTIAAVCERAAVAPRAVYDRVDDKETLFVAVYEHGIARIRDDEVLLSDDDHWRALEPHRLVREAIETLAALFTRHAAFLRAVVLISGVHDEVYRRGAQYSQDLGNRFTRAILAAGDQITHPEPESAIRMTFNTLFSTLVLRTAYGPAFATPSTDDATFLHMLTDLAERYLFGRPLQ